MSVSKTEKFPWSWLRRGPTQSPQRRGEAGLRCDLSEFQMNQNGMEMKRIDGMVSNRKGLRTKSILKRETIQSATNNFEILEPVYADVCVYKTKDHKNNRNLNDEVKYVNVKSMNDITDDKEKGIRKRPSLGFLPEPAFCVLKGQNIACCCELPCPKVPEKSMLKKFRFADGTTVKEAGKLTRGKLAKVKFNLGNIKHTYDVYLGGPTEDTSWREDKAIPALYEMGISHFNPKTKKQPGTPKSTAWEKSKIILYVLDSDNRRVEFMVDLAHLAATEERFIVAVIEPYRKGQFIGTHKLSTDELTELQNAQRVLQKIMEKENISVFVEILPALRFIKDALRRFRYKTLDFTKTKKLNKDAKDLSIWTPQDGVDPLCQNKISSKLTKFYAICGESQDDSIFLSHVDKTRTRLIGENLDVLFDGLVVVFNIPENASGLCGLIMAAYCAGIRPRSLVVNISQLDERKLQTFLKVPVVGLKDYKRARLRLRKIIISQNVSTYESNLGDAVKCGIKKVIYLR